MKKYFLLLSLFTIGCAHGKMGHVETQLAQGSITGQTIYVLPVNSDNTIFVGDKAGDIDRVTSIKSELRKRFGPKIVEQLNKRGLKAISAEKAPASGLVLAGIVTKVDNGSAAKRILLGMGAGSADMFTEFILFDAKTNNNLSKFEVIATSGGNGGLQASGSYLEAHLIDGSDKTAEYINNANSGQKAK